MDRALTDRRRTSRFAPSSPDALQGTLRPGYLVLLIDFSAGGTLVESVRPLRPGATVHLRVRADGRAIAVSAYVLRCRVWSIDPLDGVRYRGALRFDREVDWTVRRGQPGGVHPSTLLGMPSAMVEGQGPHR